MYDGIRGEVWVKVEEYRIVFDLERSAYVASMVDRDIISSLLVIFGLVGNLA